MSNCVMGLSLLADYQVRSSTYPLTANPSLTFTRTLGRQFSGGFLTRKRHSVSSEQDQSSSEDWSEDFEQIEYEDILGLAHGDQPTAIDHISPEEVSSEQSHTSPISNPFATPAGYQYPTPTSSSASRSRSHSVISRLKNLSRTSIDRPRDPLRRSSSKRSTRTQRSSRIKPKAELTSLCLDFPPPPTHIPTPIASAHCPSEPSSAPPLESAAVDDTSSVIFNFDPFRSNFILENNLVEPVLNEPTPEVQEELRSCGRPPSPVPSITRTVKGNNRTPGTLKRFKTLTKQALRASLRTPVSELSSSHPVGSRRTRSFRRTSAPASVPEPEPPRPSTEPSAPPILDDIQLTTSPLPEPGLSPPLPPLPSEPSSNTIPVIHISAEPETPTIEITDSQEHSLQIPPPPSAFRYQLVDPSELTASPFSFSTSSLINNSTRTSFIPPSPSWLSRNVPGQDLFDFRSILPSPTASQARSPYLFDLERLKPSPVDSEFNFNFASALFRPDSPPPLPVPPPSAPLTIPPPTITVCPAPRPRHPQPQPQIQTHSVVIDDYSDSDTTSVSDSTLAIESCPASPLTSSSRTVPISARASISSPALSEYLEPPPPNNRADFARGRHFHTEAEKKSCVRSHRYSTGKENKSSFVSSPQVCVRHQPIHYESSQTKKDTPVKYFLRHPTPYHNTVDPDYSPTSPYPDPSPI